MPFAAMFGTSPQIGLQTWRLPSTVADSLETEEELRRLMQDTSDPLHQLDDAAPDERLCWLW